MISNGFYSLADVSRLAKLPPSTVRSWFVGRSDGKGKGPIFEVDYENIGDERALSFLNLAEARVARFFFKCRVPSRIIRRSHELLSRELKTAHPFAHTDLRADQGRILRQGTQSTTDRRYFDVIDRQQVFPDAWKYMAAHFVFDRKSGLASMWKIADGVVVDPRVSFGQPVVADTATRTRIVAQQYVANHKNASLVSSMYSIPERAVLEAFAFEQMNGRRMAA